MIDAADSMHQAPVRVHFPAVAMPGAAGGRRRSGLRSLWRSGRRRAADALRREDASLTADDAMPVLDEAAGARSAMAEALRAVVRADEVALWEPDPMRGELVITGASRSRAARTDPDAPSPPSRTRSPAACFAGGSAELLDTSPRRRSAAPVGPHTVRVEPVYDGETVVGVLAVGWHRPDGKPQRELELITRVFATSAVGSIGWDRRYEALRREARTDALTELPNRRGWSEALAREVARGDRNGERLCVALLDLDGFKAYNDRYGHPAGDDLLRGGARAWGDAVRAGDVLARIGGDEFALLLPETELETAREVVKRLDGIAPGGHGVSAGVVERAPGESAAAVTARADCELYRAKRAAHASGRQQLSRT